MYSLHDQKTQYRFYFQNFQDTRYKIFSSLQDQKTEKNQKFQTIQKTLESILSTSQNMQDHRTLETSQVEHHTGVIQVPRGPTWVPLGDRHGVGEMLHQGTLADASSSEAASKVEKTIIVVYSLYDQKN